MMRRKTIKPFPCITTPWAEWASRLIGRSERWADAKRLSLPLYVRLCRTPLFLYQRWLSFHARLQPQFKLSIAARGVWNTTTTDMHAPQMLFLQSFASLVQRSLKLEAERKGKRADARPQLPESRPAAPALLKGEGARQAAMILAFARSRTEHLYSTLYHHHSIRRASEFAEVSRHLARREQRVEESLIARPRMALAKEAPAAVTPKRPPPEPAHNQDWHERQSSMQTARAMAEQALNIEHIADQVLKQIDRRVVARRERMGQVQGI